MFKKTVGEQFNIFLFKVIYSNKYKFNDQNKTKKKQIILDAI